MENNLGGEKRRRLTSSRENTADTNTDPHWLSLPIEIWQKVYGHLTIGDLLNMQHVCKSLKETISDKFSKVKMPDLLLTYNQLKSNTAQSYKDLVQLITETIEANSNYKELQDNPDQIHLKTFSGQEVQCIYISNVPNAIATLQTATVNFNYAQKSALVVFLPIQSHNRTILTQLATSYSLFCTQDLFAKNPWMMEVGGLQMLRAFPHPASTVSLTHYREILLFHPAMSPVNMVAVAEALRPGGQLSLHSDIPHATMVAVAGALNPGAFLYLPSSTPQATMLAVAEVLKPGAYFVLNPATSQAAMVAVAKALNSGARLHLHPYIPQATMEAVAGALQRGRCLELHPATPEATMLAVARALNSGARLAFDETTPQATMVAIAQALQPTQWL